MSFKRFACWSTDMARRAMGIEAEQAKEHIFLATHQPIKMFRQDSSETENQVAYDEQQLLKDFLAEEDYVFVAVLGDAGTGKSHLVRWLSVKIPESSNRHIILIPKIGTNLRSVITLILQGMKGRKFNKYRQRLESAESDLTHDKAKVKLLDNLALLVGSAEHEQRDGLTEFQNHLVEELPKLLHDPVFRSHLLREGQLVDILAEHILGSPNAKDINERREFQVSDLPLRMRDVAKASEDARELYALLVPDEGLQKDTVDWMNEHLNDAISQVLRLSGEDLQQLMLDVRETLAQEGTELVLLVEDFAKLQGIDMQLLEALLVGPNPKGRSELCAMRVAIACTRGYFRDFPTTVKQRIRFRVSMNVKTEEQIISEEDIQMLAARYLNASRLKEADLIRWFKSIQDKTGEWEGVPIACNDCEHADMCHSAFSSQGGMGLYPFSPTALKRMYDRKSPGEYNPRLLINEVLRHTLVHYTSDLEGGRFPPRGLLDHFGKSTMLAVVADEIEQRDPTNAERRKVLLDLWSTGDEVVNLEPGIHEAFDIPEIPGFPGEEPRERPKKKRSGKMADKKVPSEREPLISHLDEWQNQKSLPQKTAQAMRVKIFDAIRSHIDWSTEMLDQRWFVEKRTGWFRHTSVNFHNQDTQAKPAPVRVTIPVDGTSFTDAAVAMQGLLLYEQAGNWQFDEGDRYLRKYMAQLDIWCRCVLEQVNEAGRKSRKDWDPVPAAAELLALSALFDGRLSDDAHDPLEILNTMFGSPDELDESRSKAWVQLHRAFKKHQQDLIRIVLSRVACLKGTSTPQVIDASRLMDPAERMARTWRPAENIPDDISGGATNLLPIKKLRDRVDGLLDNAIEGERERYASWRTELEAAVGKKCDVISAVEEVKAVAIRADECGRYYGPNLERLIAASDAVAAAEDINGCVSVARRITKKISAEDTMVLLAQDHTKTMHAVGAFIELASKMLGSSIENTQEFVSGIGTGGDGVSVKSVMNDVDNALNRIASYLEALGGGEGGD